MWKLNRIFLNNQWVVEKKGNKKNLETNENRNTRFQNLWDATKAVLRGKLIVINAYIKKKEKYQINNLTLHLRIEFIYFIFCC